MNHVVTTLLCATDDPVRHYRWQAAAHHLVPEPGHGLETRGHDMAVHR